MAARIQRQHGLSLVEVMVSTLLVGVVLVGSLNTIGGVFRTRRIAVEVQVGPVLARDLMSEVLQAAFSDPEDPNGSIGRDSGESGGDRFDLDDIDDFDGWNSLSPKRADGTPLGYGDGWERQVTVSFVNPNSLTTSGSDTGLKLVTVTVTPPTGSPTVIQALASRLGLMERLPSADRSFVTGSQLAVQTTDTATVIVSGTAIKNHATDQ